MDRFPSSRRQRDAVAREKESIKDIIKEKGGDGFTDGHYTWLDSPLDGYYRQSFQGMFRDVLPYESGGGSMRRYIERTLEKRRGNAIGIEFGGTGSGIFGEFTPGFFKESIGVTLVDHVKARPADHEQRTQKDRERNHEVIESDIFSDGLYKLLEERLRGEKVDFIVERMAAGLESVPPGPYLVGKFLNAWYRLLREEGLLFAQVPVEMNPLLRPWTDMIRDRYREVIEVASEVGYEDGGGSKPSVLRLRKLPGAPEELPLLDPRTVRAISKRDNIYE